MKHCLKTKYIITKDKQIKDEELLNLINERDTIEVGTQVVINRQGKEMLLEIVEINGQEVWWEVKKIDKTTDVRDC